MNSTTGGVSSSSPKTIQVRDDEESDFEDIEVSVEQSDTEAKAQENYIRVGNILYYIADGEVTHAQEITETKSEGPNHYTASETHKNPAEIQKQLQKQLLNSIETSKTADTEKLLLILAYMPINEENNIPEETIKTLLSLRRNLEDNVFHTQVFVALNNLINKKDISADYKKKLIDLMDGVSFLDTNYNPDNPQQASERRIQDIGTGLSGFIVHYAQHRPDELGDGFLWDGKTRINGSGDSNKTEDSEDVEEEPRTQEEIEEAINYPIHSAIKSIDDASTDEFAENIDKIFKDASAKEILEVLEDTEDSFKDILADTDLITDDSLNSKGERIVQNIITLFEKLKEYYTISQQEWKKEEKNEFDPFLKLQEIIFPSSPSDDLYTEEPYITISQALVSAILEEEDDEEENLINYFSQDIILGETFSDAVTYASENTKSNDEVTWKEHGKTAITFFDDMQDADDLNRDSTLAATHDPTSGMAKPGLDSTRIRSFRDSVSEIYEDEGIKGLQKIIEHMISTQDDDDKEEALQAVIFTIGAEFWSQDSKNDNDINILQELISQDTGPDALGVLKAFQKLQRDHDKLLSADDSQADHTNAPKWSDLTIDETSIATQQFQSYIEAIFDTDATPSSQEQLVMIFKDKSVKDLYSNDPEAVKDQHIYPLLLALFEHANDTEDNKDKRKALISTGIDKIRSDLHAALGIDPTNNPKERRKINALLFATLNEFSQAYRNDELDKEEKITLEEDAEADKQRAKDVTMHKTIQELNFDPLTENDVYYDHPYAVTYGAITLDRYANGNIDKDKGIEAMVAAMDAINADPDINDNPNEVFNTILAMHQNGIQANDRYNIRKQQLFWMAFSKSTFYRENKDFMFGENGGGGFNAQATGLADVGIKEDSDKKGTHGALKRLGASAKNGDRDKNISNILSIFFTGEPLALIKQENDNNGPLTKIAQYIVAGLIDAHDTVKGVKGKTMRRAMDRGSTDAANNFNTSVSEIKEQTKRIPKELTTLGVGDRD